MNKMTGLIRGGKLGKWCKRGALVIAIAGTIQVLLTLYALWGELRQMQSNVQASFDVNSFLLFGGAQLFTDLITTVFFALVLYVAGVLITAYSAPEESEVTYESIKGEVEEIPVDTDEQVART